MLINNMCIKHDIETKGFTVIWFLKISSMIIWWYIYYFSNFVRLMNIVEKDMLEHLMEKGRKTGKDIICQYTLFKMTSAFIKLNCKQDH